LAPSRGGHLQAAGSGGLDAHALKGFAEAAGRRLSAGRGALLLGAARRTPAPEFRRDAAPFGLQVLCDVHRVGQLGVVHGIESLKSTESIEFFGEASENGAIKKAKTGGFRFFGLSGIKVP
jgi:hypothetical protein